MKPTVEKIAQLGQEAAYAYCERKGIRFPREIDWVDWAEDLLDHYAATAFPNGDWKLKGGQRATAWQNVVKSRARAKIKYFLGQVRHQPVVQAKETDRALEGRTEAEIEESRQRAREEIRKFFPTYGGDA